MFENCRIAPLGDSAVTVTFSEKIDEQVHSRVLAFAGMLESHPLPGMTEVVSGYTSVTVFYNPIVVWKTACPMTGHRPSPAPYAFISGMLKKMIDQPVQDSASYSQETRTVSIPVCYGGAYGPDLQAVADCAGLSPEEVITIHSSASYRTFMIGFLPGFPYLGGLPKRIAMPRRAEPRLSVPAGSVGIAGEQTGVYPFNSPGGWQIIGQTPVNLFDPAKTPPSLLRAGDYIRFKAINENEFNHWKGGERP